MANLTLTAYDVDQKLYDQIVAALASLKCNFRYELTGEGASQQAPKLILTKLSQTCLACPSQWEGVTADDQFFYARYRYGCLTAYKAPPEDDVFNHKPFYEAVHGDNLDGFMSTEDMLKYIGAELKDNLSSLPEDRRAALEALAIRGLRQTGRI